MTRLLIPQFFRFLLVGGMNTGFSYGLYALFLWLGMHFVVANGFAFVISLLFSFRTQGTLVFSNRDTRLLPRFVAVWVVIFLFNIALIGGFMRLGLTSYVAGAVALLPVILLSYMLQKFVVFVTRSRAAPSDGTRATP